MRTVRCRGCRGCARGCAQGGEPYHSAVRGLLDSLPVKCDVELTSVQVLRREFKITFLGDLLYKFEWLLCCVFLCLVKKKVKSSKYKTVG